MSDLIVDLCYFTGGNADGERVYVDDVIPADMCCTRSRGRGD